jgi:Cys-rich protein (TIGR01571 family)
VICSAAGSQGGKFFQQEKKVQIFFRIFFSHHPSFPSHSICSICTFFIVRQKIRTKYGIAGGFCGDCMSICFCSLCALSQQSRQMQAKGDKPAGICMEN